MRAALKLTFILVAAIVIAGCRQDFIDNFNPLVPRTFVVEIHFPEPTTLRAGDEVRIGGVSVGSVTEVELSPGRTDAVLEIEPQFAPIARDARAILRQKSLLSEEVYVELTVNGIPTSRQKALEALDRWTQKEPAR